MREFLGGDALKPKSFVVLLGVLSPDGLISQPCEGVSGRRAVGDSVGSATDIAAL